MAPRRHVRQIRLFHRVKRFAEQIILRGNAFQLRARANRLQGRCRGQNPRPIRFQFIERPATRQILNRALIDQSRIDPSGKIKQIGKRSVLIANIHYVAHRVQADIFKRAESV